MNIIIIEIWKIDQRKIIYLSHCWMKISTTVRKKTISEEIFDILRIVSAGYNYLWHSLIIKFYNKLPNLFNYSVTLLCDTIPLQLNKLYMEMHNFLKIKNQKVDLANPKSFSKNRNLEKILENRVSVVLRS